MRFKYSVCFLLFRKVLLRKVCNHQLEIDEDIGKYTKILKLNMLTVLTNKHEI